MDEELKALLNSIKNQTNIDIFAYSEESDAKFSTNGSDIVLPSNINFTGVFADKINGKTYFRLMYKQISLVFYIDGTGISEQTYAKFISNLIENYSDKELVLSRQEYLKAILLGECSKTQISKYIQKFSAPDYKAYAIIIECNERKVNECYSIIENYTIDSFDACTITDKNCITYVKFLDVLNEDYSSQTEFAQFLQRIIYEEGGGDAIFYIGGVVSAFDEIRTSYSQAESTLKIVKKSNSKKKINLYGEHALTKLFAEIPKEQALEYLKIVSNENITKIFGDEELLLTAEAFVENNLNACLTAKNLYIHRNTLNYRLDKIQKETGLDIRKFNDAFIFRVIKLLNGIKE